MARPADQALAVPATPLRVDGPLGFDPSRDEPTLIKRHCGGWLAKSNRRTSLKIGVTADTEEGARALFAERLCNWRELLEKHGVVSRTRMAVAADFGLDSAASGTLPRENTAECSRPKASGPTAESGDAHA